MNKRRRQPELDRPGMGLPSGEQFILNSMLKIFAFLRSVNPVLNLFQRETQELFELADETESYDVFQPYLIPRVIGIEDSSRNWSVMMVLEHLHMVNRDLKNGISAMMEGVRPRGTVDVALYKPPQDLDWGTLDRFTATNHEYVETIRQLVDKYGHLKSPIRHRHPWFGPLSAHQWHCLAAVHQRIHRRQIQKIVAMMGVV
ncbi:MAG: hypothetical protein AAF623_09090 [Planctomycetota bacterium]